MSTTEIPINISHISTKCQLLEGGFEIIVQLLLGCIALSILILKRYRENPQRPYIVWLFDSLKQIVGSFVAHAGNHLLRIKILYFFFLIDYFYS